MQQRWWVSKLCADLDGQRVLYNLDGALLRRKLDARHILTAKDTPTNEAHTFCDRCDEFVAGCPERYWNQKGQQIVEGSGLDLGKRSPQIGSDRTSETRRRGGRRTNKASRLVQVEGSTGKTSRLPSENKPKELVWDWRGPRGEVLVLRS